jgi:hypothetical protein
MQASDHIQLIAAGIDVHPEGHDAAALATTLLAPPEPR